MLFRRRAPLTDKEFVERIRRQMNINHRWRRWPLIMTIVSALAVLIMLWTVIRTFNNIPGVLDGPTYKLGLLIGSGLGGMTVCAFWVFITMLSMTLSPFLRMHRLLLKYHDLAAPSPGGQSGPTDDAAPKQG